VRRFKTEILETVPHYQSIMHFICNRISARLSEFLPRDATHSDAQRGIATAGRATFQN